MLFEEGLIVGVEVGGLRIGWLGMGMDLDLGFGELGNLQWEKTGGRDCQREDAEVPTLGLVRCVSIRALRQSE